MRETSRRKSHSQGKSDGDRVSDERRDTATAGSAGSLNLDQLSPEVIDAIAQRVVEQLSTRAVEQIAWEVVPQLAELLIKQKLEENESKTK